ncbi:hypothetical protein RQP46_006093 [Phenoliferia psychrophenolica]
MSSDRTLDGSPVDGSAPGVLAAEQHLQVSSRSPSPLPILPLSFSPLHLPSRPEPTPTQGTWATTSFGRDFWGGDLRTPAAVEIEEPTRSSSAPTSFLDFTSSAGETPSITEEDGTNSAPPRLESFGTRTRTESFIEFDAEESTPEKRHHPLRSAVSQDSFLDVSPLASPTSPTFHLDPSSDTGHDTSSLLPPSPAFLRNSVESRLSVDSAIHSSSGGNRSSAWSGSAYSSGGASLLDGFPSVPFPGTEVANGPSPETEGYSEEEAEDEEERTRTLHSVPSAATLRRPRVRSLPSFATLTNTSTNTSDWTVESTDEGHENIRQDSEDSDDDFPHVRPFSNSSFLDLSTSPERLPSSAPTLPFIPRLSTHSNSTSGDRRGSFARTIDSDDSASQRRRWSGTSWATFFSGGKNPVQAAQPPMPDGAGNGRVEEVSWVQGGGLQG